MPDQDEKHKGWRISVWICVGGAVLAVAAGGWVVWRLWPTVGLDAEQLADSAQGGDFIGGILGAAFGLAGTLLFFAALLLQGRDLRAQPDVVYQVPVVRLAHAPNRNSKNDPQEEPAPARP